ncbi:hypothetical protein AVEN_127582-1, partial [Araneus ventricosus]
MSRCVQGGFVVNAFSGVGKCIYIPWRQNVLELQEKVLHVRDNFFPGNYDGPYGLINAYCSTADDKKPEAYQKIVSGTIDNTKKNRDDPDKYNRLYSML